MKEEIKKLEEEGKEVKISFDKVRTNESASRSYMSAERTLAAWVRTALATMGFGLGINRLVILLQELQFQFPGFIKTSAPYQMLGVALIAASMCIATLSGIRFISYTKYYKREYKLPAYHKEWLPAVYAFLVTAFGLTLLVFIFWEKWH